MQIDNKHIKKQFEKSMQDYDQNATVQILMASKLVFELSKISTTFDLSWQTLIAFIISFCLVCALTYLTDKFSEKKHD